MIPFRSRTPICLSVGTPPRQRASRETSRSESRRSELTKLSAKWIADSSSAMRSRGVDPVRGDLRRTLHVSSRSDSTQSDSPSDKNNLKTPRKRRQQIGGGKVE